jgi:hypothetical protein
MDEAGPGVAGGYVAFISYSHKDEAIGRWLHRKLEGYRLPKRLAGTEGEDGEVPTRLTPIFRDRDELAAAGDLSEKVRAALAVSRNLIVVCSPHSAASPWVAKEIATFRELHRDRPIFTAIVEGEPDQCFSPALLEGGAEPLAADLRKEGDGRRLGLLKLVAGLAGVGLDALVQRDAARRVRRVTYVTAAAVAAMLILALLTAFALNARREAERQRGAAEGLVEFMLTDLRDKLQGLGSLGAMEAVNARALRYYGGRHDLANLSDQSLVLRARILQAIGEDDLAADDLDGALAAFKEARQTTGEQLARAPDDPERLFENSRTDFGFGRVNELRGEWDLAQHHYAEFAAAAERLVAAAPDNADYLMKAASSAIDLGNVQLSGRDNPAAAQHWYDKAVTWLTRGDRIRPHDEHVLLSLANAYGWLADSYYQRRDWDRALETRRTQVAVFARLPELREVNWEIKFRLAAARRGLAFALARKCLIDEARAELAGSKASAGELVEHDPRNAEWAKFAKKLASDPLRPDFDLRRKAAAGTAQEDRICAPPASSPPSARAAAGHSRH